MIFSGIQKSSLVDYPGLVSCVLFVPGCNYDCFFCHNRSLFNGPHEVLNPDKIESFLNKRAGLLDAVVVTGGEPTLQDGLVETLLHLKEMGYRTKLDTNGSNPDVVAAVLEKKAGDYFAVDYKAPAAQYGEICGANADAKAVQRTIDLLLSHGAAFEVRTTVIPQLSKDDLLKMASELPAVPRWSLNRYRKPEFYKASDEGRISAVVWTQEQINQFAKAMFAVQPNMVLHP